jgi:hypothetical protein
VWQGIGPRHVRQVVAVGIGGGVTVFVPRIGPVRLTEYDPGLGLGERVGGAVHGLAVESDGGERDDRGEFQLEQLAPRSGQGLDDGTLSEDAVTEAGNGIAAPLNDVAEQRIVGAVGDWSVRGSCPRIWTV